MSSENSMMESIKRNVAIVIGDLERNGIENDYGQKALQFLENHIDRHREEFSEKAKDSIYACVGSYLGECLCRAYVGKWIEHENGNWGVEMFDGKLTAFPFAKVNKWIESGTSGDSIVSMFMMTPTVLKISQEKNKPES